MKDIGIFLRYSPHRLRSPTTDGQDESTPQVYWLYNAAYKVDTNFISVLARCVNERILQVVYIFFQALCKSTHVFFICIVKIAMVETAPTMLMIDGYSCDWNGIVFVPKHVALTANTGATDLVLFHTNEVIISAMATQITGVSNICWTVCSSVDQRKCQISASLAFVRGIHWWSVNSPCKILNALTCWWIKLRKLPCTAIFWRFKFQAIFSEIQILSWHFMLSK